MALRMYTLPSSSCPALTRGLLEYLQIPGSHVKVILNNRCLNASALSPQRLPRSMQSTASGTSRISRPISSSDANRVLDQSTSGLYMVIDSYSGSEARHQVRAK